MGGKYPTLFSCSIPDNYVIFIGESRNTKLPFFKKSPSRDLPDRRSLLGLYRKINHY